jgi:transcriptional regulator with XRE-family HTH domain
MATSPTVRRRRLGGELRRLRLDAQKTIDDVAADTHISKSVLSRIETGQSSAKAGHVEKLLAYFEAPPQLVATLTQLARDSRRRGWWSVGGGELLDATRTLIGLEAEASMIQDYSGQVINGLLQVPEYSRAILKAVLPHPDEENVQAALNFRVRRQARLSEIDLFVILAEELLIRRVGGSATMVRQLTRLLEASEEPRITVQVLDLDVGAHAGSAGDFSIISFPERNSSPAVYLEGTGWDSCIEEPSDVAGFQRRFDLLRTDALSQPASRDRINQHLKDLRS